MPKLSSTRARAMAHRQHGLHDTAATTAAAQQAANYGRFEREALAAAGGPLDAAELTRRATALRRAHMGMLSERAAEVRRANAAKRNGKSAAAQATVRLNAEAERGLAELRTLEAQRNKRKGKK